MRVAYVNGQFLPHAHARVAMEDRGYQFSDGIYEVMAFFNRRLLNRDLHLERMQQSLNEMRIPEVMSERALYLVIAELIARNQREHGLVYLQVTRGVVSRSHAFSGAIKPVLTMSIMPMKLPKEEVRDAGVKVITVPDQRWLRRDIKSISLLPNTLAKQAASDTGVFEAWQVEHGHITEGSLSNAYIVNKKGMLQTHPDNGLILGGVTRSLTLAFAKEKGLTVVEEPFTMDDIRSAQEAFLTSCSSNVLPVVQVDDIMIANGVVGTKTRNLMQAYHQHIEKETGYVIT